MADESTGIRRSHSLPLRLMLGMQEALFQNPESDPRGLRRIPHSNSQLIDGQDNTTTHSDDTTSVQIMPDSSLLYLRGANKDIDALLQLGQEYVNNGSSNPEWFDGFHMRGADDTSAVLLVNRTTDDIDRFLRLAEERLSTSIAPRRISVTEAHVANMAKSRLKKKSRSKHPSDIDHLLEVGRSSRSQNSSVSSFDDFGDQTGDQTKLQEPQTNTAKRSITVVKHKLSHNRHSSDTDTTTTTTSTSGVDVCMITISSEPRDFDEVVGWGSEQEQDPVFQDVQELIGMGEFGSLKQLPNHETLVINTENTSLLDLDHLIKLGENSTTTGTKPAHSTTATAAATTTTNKTKKVRRHTVSGSQPSINNLPKPPVSPNLSAEGLSKRDSTGHRSVGDLLGVINRARNLQPSPKEMKRVSSLVTRQPEDIDGLVSIGSDDNIAARPRGVNRRRSLSLTLKRVRTQLRHSPTTEDVNSSRDSSPPSPPRIEVTLDENAPPTLDRSKSSVSKKSRPRSTGGWPSMFSTDNARLAGSSTVRSTEKNDKLASTDIDSLFDMGS